MDIMIINGPNLNLLGKREPDIYGELSFTTYLKELHQLFPEVNIEYFQSNIEGEIIDQIQSIGFDFDGIILNAGAYAHTSIAIADALSSVDTPTIEVHISNIFARESYRHHSYIAPKADGIICGMGLRGYEMAIRYFI